jgi:hypothetical protein
MYQSDVGKSVNANMQSKMRLKENIMVMAEAQVMRRLEK